MILYFEKGDIAKAAGVQARTVKHWSARGWISPVARTPHGTRLFAPATIRAFLKERAIRQKALAERLAERRRAKGRRK